MTSFKCVHLQNLIVINFSFPAHVNDAKNGKALDEELLRKRALIVCILSFLEYKVDTDALMIIRDPEVKKQSQQLVSLL